MGPRCVVYGASAGRLTAKQREVLEALKRGRANKATRAVRSRRRKRTPSHLLVATSGGASRRVSPGFAEPSEIHPWLVAIVGELRSSVRPRGRRSKYTSVGWNTRVNSAIEIAPPITTIASGR